MPNMAAVGSMCGKMVNYECVWLYIWTCMIGFLSLLSFLLSFDHLGFRLILYYPEETKYTFGIYY
jgi:hypothetical protein